ncbi:MAG: PorT family protein [Prevotellaceae bacterium]|jgi:hypothetical protein|nr:PorT family protein [Prevotellaceae bacterium]
MNDKKNILREKLQNHQLPIDDSFWAEMETRLQKRKRSKIVPLWWASGIAATIAALVMLFVPNPDGKQKTSISKKTQDIGNQENIFGNLEPEKKSENKNAELQNYEKAPLPSRFKNSEFAESINNQQIADTIPQGSNVVQVPKQASEKPDKHESPEVTELTPKKTLADYASDKDRQKAPRDARKRQTLSIAMNVGYGSGASDFTEGETSVYSRAPALAGDANGISTGLDNARANESLKKLLAEYPQTTYMPPLTVGLSVRKGITEYLSVETGLIYTYLQTKFSNETNRHQHGSATLQVHYLGIPLNAVYMLFNHRKWKMYASAGTTLEKGLWLDYEKITTFNFAPDDTERQHLAGKVARLQWSAGASVGAEVNLTKNISAYFEPRIAYYFENEQPLSIRTDSPLHVGLNAGLRFSINK